MLGRDDEERHPLVTSGNHARDQVRRAGAGIPEHRRDLSGRLVQALCHMGARRLVPDRDEAHLVRLQRRQQGIDLRARQAEHEADTLTLEAARSLWHVRVGVHARAATNSAS